MAKQVSAEEIVPGTKAYKKAFPYRYHISYQFTTSTGNGFGETSLDLAKKIRSEEDVALIRKNIRESLEVGNIKESNVVVLFWQLFEE